MLGFLLSCVKKQPTFEGWAAQISLLCGKSVSKQAVFDRIHSSTVDFAKALLEHVVMQKNRKQFDSTLFNSFGRVLLQDSTTLKLPDCLSNSYPGNASHGVQKAVARIQSIIDLKAIKFLHFGLGAYTQNDQSASGFITTLVKKTDLVIRDLGYFAIDTFKSLIASEVLFLSRMKFNVGLYNLDGSPIALKKLLHKRALVDRWVLVGSKKKIRVRLVMIPLPAKQTAEKVRKARQDRDKRLNHNEDYYKWLGFNIYITTVSEAIWTAGDVAAAYKVRWQMEIIFKSWKSGFDLQKILHEGCKNKDRVDVNIYLMLLLMCLFMQKIYVCYRHEIEKKTGKKLSLIKLAMFVGNNIVEVLSLTKRKLMETLSRYCCYQIRPDRVNMTDLYQNLKN